MRIQHNIAAMNAYRNYNNNTSSLSKNLEKLSSGYKINRAGDDAAGLAISEKMRAQITGLNAAQKNVKDGVSLVKTAEGAMQEIQDMLNRMDYLATQSANGTYDNEVDRANLQKEVDALKTEINRIADSANFNGINLLDGSMDKNADLTTKLDFTVGKGLPQVGDRLGVDTVLHKAPGSGDKGSSFSIDMYDFEFNNQKGDTMTIHVGDTDISITSLDNNTKTVNGATVNDTLKGKDLIAKILAGDDTANNTYTVKINGEKYTAGDNITINGQEFSLTNAGEGRLTFQQISAPKTKDEEINPSMNVTVSGKVVASKAKYSFDTNGITMADGDKVMVGDEELTYDTDWATTLGTSKKYDAKVTGTTVELTAKSGGVSKEAPKISYKKAAANSVPGTPTDGTNGTQGKYTFSVNKGDSITIGGTTFDNTYNKAFTAGTIAGTVIDIGGTKYEVTGNLADTTNATNTLTLTEIGQDGTTTATGIFTGGPKTIEDSNGNTATVATAGVAATKWTNEIDLNGWTGGELQFFTQKVAHDGVSIASSLQAAIDSGAIKHADFDLSVDATGNKLVMTAKEVGKVADIGVTAPAATDIKYSNGADIKVSTISKGSDAVENPNGDYNVATTVISKVTADDAHRIASTHFNLTEDMATDGSVLTIGDQKFTFTSNKDMIGMEGYIDITSGDINTIAEKLTKAAEKNHVWTVGHDGNGHITLRETEAHDNDYKLDANKGVVNAPSDGWDLRTAEGIAKSLSFISGTTKSGTPLTLQIGDTSDKFNQMEVSIGDMHVDAMGSKNGKSIADVDISSQAGAQEAVGVIKDAINYVSSVRGDLGAIQNRLEHTQNNLSVMAENIQDAESTIRDTDVAEEMMSYVKNNILVQSAQAMLAQANQLPQGVLQLLG